MDLSRIKFHETYELRLPDSPLLPDGIDEIMRTLAAELMLGEITPLIDKLPSDWTWDWMVAHGTYSGTLPKRIQNWLFKTLAYKLSTAAVSQIGNIVDRYTLKASAFRFDFDHDFLWQRGEFGDQKSCLWSEKPSVLSMLKYQDAFAIRLYDPDQPDTQQGIGRALVLPWKATGYKRGDLSESDALLVFNGYGLSKKEYENTVGGDKKTFGKMQTLDYGRALAMFLGLSYERVSMTINSEFVESGSHGRWYLNNNGHAVLVGPVDTVRKFKPKYKAAGTELIRLDVKWGSVILNAPFTQCGGGCGRRLSRWETATMNEGVLAPNDRRYCNDCFERDWTECLACHKIIPKNLRRSVKSNFSERAFFCDEHTRANSFSCRFCHERWSLEDRAYYHAWDEKKLKVERRVCCPNCYGKRIAFCQSCSRDYEKTDLTLVVTENPEQMRVHRHPVTGKLVYGTMIPQPCPHCRAREAKTVPDKEEYLPDPLAVPAAEVEAVSALEASAVSRAPIDVRPDILLGRVPQEAMPEKYHAAAMHEMEALTSYFQRYREEDYLDGNLTTLYTEKVRSYRMEHAGELLQILSVTQNEWLPDWMELVRISFSTSSTVLYFGHRNRSQTIEPD